MHTSTLLDDCPDCRRGKNPANRLLCAQAFVKADVNLGYKNSEGETALGVMQRCAKEDGFVVNPELQAVLTP